MDNTFIDHLLSDSELGAGNFIYKIHQKMQNKTLPLVFVDQPFIDQKNKEHTEMSLDFLVSTADHCAIYYHNVGVEPKDVVMLYFDESINYLLQFIAITSLGAIPFFVNGRLEKETVISLAKESYVDFIVTDTTRKLQLFPLVETNDLPINLIDSKQLTIPSNNKRPNLYKHDNDDTVMLAHTSGTTGIPKVVQFTHESMYYGVRKQMKKQRGERILSLLPHSHASSVTMTMSTLSRLASLKIQTSKDIVKILKQVESYQPDLIASFPKVLVDICRHDLSSYNLKSIQCWLSTGDANHENHIKKLMSVGHHIENGIKKNGAIFIDNFGSTECSFAIFRNVHNPNKDRYNRCIGFPFSWVSWAILSLDGSILGANQVGLLGIKSGSLTKGYWNNSYLTEKNKLSGFWLTGDLVYRDDDGYFYHVDRVSDQIKTKEGIFYSCQAEELILSQFPNVFEISFVGIQDLNNEKSILATVEIQLGNTLIDPDELKERFNTLFRYKKWPQITKLVLDSAHNYVGVTGKKLKNKMREVF